MLAIRDSKDAPKKLVPNILPCKVNYDGSVNAGERYWHPQQEGGESIAYFRGRKLIGKGIKVPERCEGAVLRITDDVVAINTAWPRDDGDNVDNEVGEDEEHDTAAETKKAEKLATFDEIMLWSHEAMADVDEDPYVKGVEEWMAFAQAIHSQDDEGEVVEGKPA